MPAYFLPCECRAEIAVNAGQAGESVVCAACGRRVEVPKLRELMRLRPVESAGQVRRVRSAALSSAGLAALIAAAALVSSFMIVPRIPVVSVEMHKAAFGRMTDDEVHAAWTKWMSKATVHQPPTEEEAAFQRRYRMAATMSLGLQIVGGIAAVVALVAFATSLRVRGDGQSRQLSTKL